jgi:uncharacterized protein (TIGR02172 family)
MKTGRLIGVGKTANVYEWEDVKVLKLFNKEYSFDAVNYEFNNALAVKDMYFAKPKVYEMILYGDQYGIIYDKLNGVNLLDWVVKTGDVQKCASYMAQTHKELMQNNISNVPYYKDFLRHHVHKALLPIEKQQEVLSKIDKLPDGHTFCHGDFHPGNLLISGDKAYVIDFMNVCQGYYLYDIARTVYLIEYTPLPADVKDKEAIIQIRKVLADMYLVQMNIAREMIQEYLSIILIARKGECPDEMQDI